MEGQAAENLVATNRSVEVLKPTSVTSAGGWPTTVARRSVMPSTGMGAPTPGASVRLMTADRTPNNHLRSAVAGASAIRIGCVLK